MLLLIRKYVVLVIFVGLVFIGGLFAWDRHKLNNSDAATKAWIAKVAADDSMIVQLAQQRDAALASRTQFVPVYTAGKTQIIHDAAGNPQAETGVAAAFALADKQKAVDDAVIKADSVLIEGQKKEITDLKNKPDPYVKRAVWKVGIGYASIQRDKDMQSAPAIRGGVDYRVLGSLSISADAQITMPGKGRSNPTMQETVLVNIKF